MIRSIVRKGSLPVLAAAHMRLSFVLACCDGARPAKRQRPPTPVTNSSRAQPRSRPWRSRCPHRRRTCGPGWSDGVWEGGWYSWDLLDNRGRPSATRIDPELQDLAVGSRIPRYPAGRLLPCRGVRARQDPGTQIRPRISIWTTLRPARPEAQRLHRRNLGFSLESAARWWDAAGRPDARSRKACCDRSARRRLFGEPAHFIMQHRQFCNLRRRVDRTRVQEELQ